jgi:peptidoglycan/LPS O-acetylase OafA/YrhL
MASMRGYARDLAAACAALVAPAARVYPAERRMARLMLLDGSRALAAVAVLFFHYVHFFYPLGTFAKADAMAPHAPMYAQLWLLYELGRFGVQLFWMISGFVFAAVYYGRPATSREFVVNRFARLYPLHFATLLLVTALQFAAIARFGTHLLFVAFDVPHFLLQLAFASNWLVRFQLSFNGPIWSVSVEVLIYAVFWLTRHRLPALGVIGPLALAAAMMVLRWTVYETEASNCGFHFFLGVALCTVWRSFVRLPRTLMTVGGAMLATGAAGLVAVGAERAWVAQIVLVPLLFGGLILLLVAIEDFAPVRLRAAFAALGDRTYSIYLIHVPVQLALFLVLGPRIAELARQAWFLPLFIGLVMVVAWPCYRWFEAPARDWLRRFARPRPRAAAAPAAA